jgi:hypothetical protein
LTWLWGASSCLVSSGKVSSKTYQSRIGKLFAKSLSVKFWKAFANSNEALIGLFSLVRFGVDPLFRLLFSDGLLVDLITLNHRALVRPPNNQAKSDI